MMGFLSTTDFMPRSKEEEELLAITETLLKLNSAMTKIVGLSAGTYAPGVSLEQSIKDSIVLLDSDSEYRVQQTSTYYSSSSVGRLQRLEALEAEMDSVFSVIENNSGGSDV